MPLTYDELATIKEKCRVALQSRIAEGFKLHRFAYYEVSEDGNTKHCCLVGAVANTPYKPNGLSLEGYIGLAASHLNLTEPMLASLEVGFCGFSSKYVKEGDHKELHQIGEELFEEFKQHYHVTGLAHARTN